MDDFIDIPGFEGLYKINKSGEIKSTDRIRLGRGGCIRKYFGKTLKWKINNRGYAYVDITDCDHKIHRYLVHRLVALTFLPNPNNLPQINHIDENPLNNHIDNLEWCTNEYNQHYSKTYLKAQQATGLVATPVKQFNLNGEFIAEYNSFTEAEKATGVDHSGISCCCKGKYKTAGGYIWKYKQYEEKRT